MAEVSGTADQVVSVTFGERFEVLPGSQYVVNPARRGDWTDLVEALKAATPCPTASCT